MKRKEHALGLGIADLLVEECDKRFFAQASSVDDFARLEFDPVLERCLLSVCRRVLDENCRGCLDGDRFFVVEEISGAHCRDVGFRIVVPDAHSMRVLARVLLDGIRRASVGVSLAKNWIDSAALDAVVA